MRVSFCLEIPCPVLVHLSQVTHIMFAMERKFGKTEAVSCDGFLHIVPAISSHTEKFSLMRGTKGLWRAVGQPAPGPAGF